MGRPLRTDTANTIFHVINRANARAQIFDTDTDYNLFVEILEEAKERIPMRIIAFCLMPNHWHLVLQPLQE